LYKASSSVYSFLCVQNAFLSHCPNRHPDFQQLIQLDYIPLPDEKGNNKKKNDLYQVPSSIKD